MCIYIFVSYRSTDINISLLLVKSSRKKPESDRDIFVQLSRLFFFFAKARNESLVTL